MSYKTASEYWRARRERERNRQAFAHIKPSRDFADNKCPECKGPLTTSGYCINDPTRCRRAYTD